MQPLTIEQLQSLGFDIAYKKRNGQKVFACACHTDEELDSLIGTFFELPTFRHIIKRVADSAKEKEKQRITEKFAKTMFD